jgi:hypothetical protein
MRLTRVKNRIDNIWDKYSIFLDDLVKLSVNENECEVSLIELLQFSNRIKSTTFAPQYWREGLPLGASHPPAPTVEEMRRGRLGELSDKIVVEQRDELRLVEQAEVEKKLYDEQRPILHKVPSSSAAPPAVPGPPSPPPPPPPPPRTRQPVGKSTLSLPVPPPPPLKQEHHPSPKTKTAKEQISPAPSATRAPPPPPPPRVEQTKERPVREAASEVLQSPAASAGAEKPAPKRAVNLHQFFGMGSDSEESQDDE